MRRSFAIWLVCVVTVGCERRVNESVHYDLEMKEGPTASVHIPFQDTKEADVFSRILREFTQAHTIPEVQDRVVSYYSNPQFKIMPMYQGSNVLISSFCVLDPRDSYGQSRISVLRRDFAPTQFKLLADDYLNRFRQIFSNRVVSAFEDNRK